MSPVATWKFESLTPKRKRKGSVMVGDTVRIVAWRRNPWPARNLTRVGVDRASPCRYRPDEDPSLTWIVYGRANAILFRRGDPAGHSLAENSFLSSPAALRERPSWRGPRRHGRIPLHSKHQRHQQYPGWLVHGPNAALFANAGLRRRPLVEDRGSPTESLHRRRHRHL